MKRSGFRVAAAAGSRPAKNGNLPNRARLTKKFAICNADGEGDPGAFMDRLIMEGDLHSVIEAMATLPMQSERSMAIFTSALNIP